MANSATGREKIPQPKRKQALKRDHYECSGCGKKGRQVGGPVILHVHHKHPDPDDRDRHAMSNLTTLCRHCHWWLHHRPTSEYVPFEVTAADHRTLWPHDYLIMRILDENGLLSPTAVQDRIGLNLAESTVRERLWVLGGLDHEVASRDIRFVAQDAGSGDWGLRDQVAMPERGRVPDDRRTFKQRLEDEFARRAVAWGIDREIIAEQFDVVERTIWNKQRRAQVYEFPLERLDSSDIPTPTGNEEREGLERSEAVATQGGEATARAGSQDTAQSPDLGEPDEVWGTAADDTGSESDDVMAAILDELSANEDAV